MATSFLSKLIILAAILIATAVCSKQCEISRYEHKPRVFVLTDMSNEPDDQMSFVRFLTYSNEFNIQGLAGVTSIHKNDSIDLETCRHVLNAYGEVVDNLNANVPNFEAARYPSSKSLLEKLVSGHEVYGLAALDLELSSAAKRLIHTTDKASANDPLWVSVWGGANVLAEALNHVSSARSADETADFVKKLRVYTISDQDNTGAWIRNRFPQLFYIASIHPMSEYTLAAWNGISGEQMRHFDEGGPDTSLITNEWLEKHVRIGKLGEWYPEWHFIMEGDTPSFLPLVRNGLGDIEHPEWGSWGGRHNLMDLSGEFSRLYTDASDWAEGVNGKYYLSKYATIWRWREAYQFDFAARMQWTVNGNFSTNNHQPVAIVNDTCGPNHIEVPLKANTTIVLDASSSWDPDGDELSFSWFHYREPTRFLEGQNIPEVSPDVEFESVNGQGSIMRIIPKNFTKDIHIILTVRDSGDMGLITYRRIILRSD